MLQLNVIRDNLQGEIINNNITKRMIEQHVNKNAGVNKLPKTTELRSEIVFQEDRMYYDMLNFINNANYIRKGINESIRTYELAMTFNNITGNNVTHKNKLPQLMSRIMLEHPELSITKKVRNYGTVYVGIGLSTSPPAEPRRPPMTDKEKNDKRAIRNRHTLDTIKDIICRRTGWTIIQYQQMVNLGLICIIRGKTGPNIEAIIAIMVGRLTQYVANKIQKLQKLEKYAQLVKADLSRCTQLDLQLTENETPIYTNRLMAATRTYDAGTKLEKEINSYTNILQSLPQLQYIEYPNIQHIYELAIWLKDNTMYKTRLDMKLVQTNYDGDIPQAVDWIIEDTIYDYSENYTRITK